MSVYLQTCNYRTSLESIGAQDSNTTRVLQLRFSSDMVDVDMTSFLSLGGGQGHRQSDSRSQTYHKLH